MIYLITYFISGRLIITSRVWSLLRNIYCVTRTSCRLMISLPMVSLFKNLCENTATFLNQSGGKPLILKKISKDESLIFTASTVAIEYPVNKTVDKVYGKISHKGKENKSGVGSSTKSDVTCHNCGKKGHLKRNWKSNRNGSNERLSNTSIIKLPKWVTQKPMISYVQNLATATMNFKKHYYKRCTS